MVGLFEDIDALGLSNSYNKYIVRLNPVLERMGARGIPVSPEKHKEFSEVLEKRLSEWESNIQALVPDEVKDWSPRAGYKREPKCTEGLVKRWFPLDDLNTREERWVKLKPWAPSHAGLTRYANHRGHGLPKHFKTGKVTFEEEELERLCKRTGDPLYAAILEHRQIQTFAANHVKNWSPAADGRVHPTFYYDTGTGQLASRRPNVQNAPRHGGDLADQFRGMVSVPGEYTLVEFDYKAFHVMTLAFEAQDEVLMRAGRIDPHSFVTAHFLRLPDHDKCWGWDDEKLGAYLAKVKKEHAQVRNEKIKHAFLGYDNGMGYRKLFFQYREFFGSQNEAKSVMGLFDSLFSRAKEYRERVCQQAHSQGYLISKFGCIRWFWEVYKNQGGDWSAGDDHEAALSFFTQNDAHCHLKEAMLALEGMGALEEFGFINTIHDSLMFCTGNQAVEKCVKVVKDAMEAPSTVLVDPVVAPNGLVVKCEVSGGQSWNRMKAM